MSELQFFCLLRLVHTLCSDQMSGITQVLLKMANVSIVSMDPHRTLVDHPNFSCTLCVHMFSVEVLRVNKSSTSG